MFYFHTLDFVRDNIPLESLSQVRNTLKIKKTSSVRKSITDDKRDTDEKKQPDARFHRAVEAYRDVLKVADRRERILHAYQIMSSPVKTIDPDLGIVEAWKKLKDKEVSHMPVLSERRDVIGIVSDRDLLKDIIVTPFGVETGSDKTVRDVMTVGVISASLVTDIRRIAKAMFLNHIGTMPILDEERHLIGIVTRSDILHALINYPPLSLWG